MIYPSELESWQLALVRAFDETVLRPPAVDEPPTEKRLFLRLVSCSFPDQPARRTTDALAEHLEVEPRSIRRMIVELNAKLDGFFAEGGPGGRSIWRFRIVHLPVGRPSKDQAETRNRVVFEFNCNAGFELRKLMAPHLAATLDSPATAVCIVRSEPLSFLDTQSCFELRHGGLASMGDLAAQAASDEFAALLERLVRDGRFRVKRGSSAAEENALAARFQTFFAAEAVPVAIESPGRLPAYGPLYDGRHLVLFGSAATNAAIEKMDWPEALPLRLCRYPLREEGAGPLQRIYLLLSRFPNPLAPGRTVTILEARHDRAYEAIGRILEAPERVREFLAKVGVASDDVLPDRFQVLVSVEINDRDELAGDGNLKVVDRRGFPGGLRRPPDRVIPMPAQNKKGAGG